MLVRRLSLSLLSSSSLLLLCLISSYLLDRVSAVTADEPGHRDLIVNVRSSRREIGKKNQCFEKVGRRRKKVKKVAESRHFPFFLPSLLRPKKRRKSNPLLALFTPQRRQAKKKKPSQHSHGAPPQRQVGSAQGQAVPDHRHPGMEGDDGKELSLALSDSALAPSLSRHASAEQEGGGF